MTKNVTPIKKNAEDQMMDDFKPTKQNISIIYESAEWNEATDKYEDKVLAYLDIKGYQLNGPYLIVQLHDDSQFVYPMSAVSSLKLWVTK